MSQATFGTAALHVRALSVEESPTNITEVDVLADPTTPNSINTVLSGAGHKRSKYSIEGFCTYLELLPLQSYFNGKQVKILTVYFEGDMLVEEYCIIQDLKWKLQVAAKKVNITMDLIQADEPIIEES